jgi:hypothetical protein
MTLFNDPIRIQGGRVISLWPPEQAASRGPGHTGPRRAWALDYPARPAHTLTRADRGGEGTDHPGTVAQ